LARKATRRVTVSVALSDATETVARVNRLERDLIMASARNDRTEVDRLEAEVAAKRVELSEHYAEIEFAACPPGDFEALQTDFTSDDGGIDSGKLSANLPALVVACVVDEELRDEEFWKEQLESGAWSYGERVNLANRLVGLNVTAPDERIPFA
jgi:hypothetical protein